MEHALLHKQLPTMALENLPRAPSPPGRPPVARRPLPSPPVAPAPPRRKRQLGPSGVSSSSASARSSSGGGSPKGRQKSCGSCDELGLRPEAAAPGVAHLFGGPPQQKTTCPKGHDPSMQTPGPSNGEPRPLKALKGPQQQPIWRAQKQLGPLG